MDLRRLRAADVFAGLFGAALVGLLWAPWFRVPQPSAASQLGPGSVGYAPLDIGGSASAWQAMSVNDVLLCIAGVLGVWLVLTTVASSTAAVPLTTSVFATGFGLLGSVLAVLRLIWPPDLGPGPTDLAWGAWAGTAAAIGLALSACIAMGSERRTDFDVSAIPMTPGPPVSS